jgi:osmoprotectant transport system permease protein
VSFLGSVVDYLREVTNWWGPGGILHRLAQHCQISFVAVAAAVLLAVPLSVWLGHRRRFGLLSVNVSNVGRALPSFAVLVVGTQLMGFRSEPVIGSLVVFLALVLLAVPPMVTNSYVAMSEVSDDIRDAARGMGLSDLQCLWRVELPLAVPLIMAGVRTSAVQVVATATIAAVVGAGGLGRYIVDGFAIGDAGHVEVFVGALIVALLSVATEVVFAGLQRLLTARGLRAERSPDRSNRWRRRSLGAAESVALEPM